MSYLSLFLLVFPSFTFFSAYSFVSFSDLQLKTIFKCKVSKLLFEVLNHKRGIESYDWLDRNKNGFKASPQKSQLKISWKVLSVQNMAKYNLLKVAFTFLVCLCTAFIFLQIIESQTVITTNPSTLVVYIYYTYLSGK